MALHRLPPEEQFLELWEDHIEHQFGANPPPHCHPIRQFKPHATSPSPRKWTLDFTWPAYQVAVEIQGMRGHHLTVKGMYDDHEKLRRLLLEGWIVLPFLGKDLTQRPAEVVQQVLDAVQLQRDRGVHPVEPRRGSILR